MVLLFTMAAEQGEAARALARGLRARDPELLERLVGQYHYRLLRYLTALTANPTLAEDLLQETWLRVLERGRQYKPEFRFEPWLYAIARNLFLDRVRRKPEIGLGARGGEPGAMDAGERDLPDPAAPSPYDVYRRAQESAGVQRALLGVAAVYREALALRFQEDLTLAEIAAVTGAGLSTVKSRLYRGLASLEKQLPPGGGA